MGDLKIVNFPNRRSRAAKTGDAKLADDVQKAWRVLWRKIALARAAGLDVQMEVSQNDEPHITRRF